MKKIINTPESVVIEMCKGIIKAHPELELIEKYKVIKKAKIDKNKVTLISGGGSGHEPAHAGFIGEGMLDAAICGDVFASPSIMQIYNGIVKTESNKGTLLIVKNYSGDCMNFDGAAEMAEEDDDMNVTAVYVKDDVALDIAEGAEGQFSVGRRGVAGTIFVHKIAGAAAAKGLDLDGVKAAAQKAIDNVRSVGFALTSCTVPAAGAPTFDLEADKLEFGVGIHGEPGIAREDLMTADELAKKCIALIAKDMKLKGDEEIALLINGFGGTPLQELYLFNNSVSTILEEKGIKIYKTLVGSYMTSIDMAGASVSVLKLDAELKELLDSPVNTPALK